MRVVRGSAGIPRREPFAVWRSLSWLPMGGQVCGHDVLAWDSVHGSSVGPVGAVAAPPLEVDRVLSVLVGLASHQEQTLRLFNNEVY